VDGLGSFGAPSSFREGDLGQDAVPEAQLLLAQLLEALAHSLTSHVKATIERHMAFVSITNMRYPSLKGPSSYQPLHGAIPMNSTYTPSRVSLSCTLKATSISIVWMRSPYEDEKEHDSDDDSNSHSDGVHHLVTLPLLSAFLFSLPPSSSSSSSSSVSAHLEVWRGPEVERVELRPEGRDADHIHGQAEHALVHLRGFKGGGAKWDEKAGKATAADNSNQARVTTFIRK
jgi:hypothetical protein